MNNFTVNVFSAIIRNTQTLVSNVLRLKNILRKLGSHLSSYNAELLMAKLSQEFFVSKTIDAFEYTQTA